jgi:hypothetical protein
MIIIINLNNKKQLIPPVLKVRKLGLWSGVGGFLALVVPI